MSGFDKAKVNLFSSHGIDRQKTLSKQRSEFSEVSININCFMNDCLLYNGLNSPKVLGNEGKALNASLIPAFFSLELVSKVAQYFTFVTITQKKKLLDRSRKLLCSCCKRNCQCAVSV